MKIIVDIGHPAQVHFFKNMIWEMEKRGHKIRITARDKDVVIHLLHAYGFDFINLGKTKNGILNKALGLIEFDYKLIKNVKSFNPDIFIGAGSMYAAHAAAFLNKPYIAFEDTEHQTGQFILYAPFASAICTPTSFKKNLGSKQISYNGFKELAYLHPNYFTPDCSSIDELGLSSGERFIILRFVAWKASHDIGHKGISMDMKKQYIHELNKYGRVLITSEDEELPEDFKKNKLKISPEKFHSLLNYAQLYIGEGGSTSTEAALLGTPSILISTLAKFCGVFEDLHKYNLIYTFDDDRKALEKAINILNDSDSKKNWIHKKNLMLKDKIDVTKFMIELIESYHLTNK